MRAFVYMSALVGVGAIHAGVALAQAPAGAPPVTPTAAPRATGKIAVFNVAKVMRDYQKWQAFAKVMNEKRTAASAQIIKMRTEIANKQQEIQAEPIQAKKEDGTRKLLELQRTLEDTERTLRKQLDDESAQYLKNLFIEIQRCVKAVVDAYGFDVVFAYPDALTAEEMNSPMYFDLKLRPPAAMPFYISPAADMTDALIETLNKHFPPDKAATPTTPAPGGTTPPATVAPPGNR